nr:MAG TPA: hypothetical protein [Caudoviricetes sp.]
MPPIRGKHRKICVRMRVRGYPYPHSFHPSFLSS